MTNGWAVKEGDVINIRTVSDTRRAAIVNWLVIVPKVMIYNHMTDDEIESRWLWYSSKSSDNVFVIEVNVIERYSHENR